MGADIVEGNVTYKTLLVDKIIALNEGDIIYVTVEKRDSANDGHIILRTGMYSFLEVEEI